MKIRMKKIGLLLVAFLLVSQVNAQTAVFNDLLRKHVSKNGIVDYKSFKNDEAKLDNYISYLEKLRQQNLGQKINKKPFG